MKNRVRHYRSVSGGLENFYFCVKSLNSEPGLPASLALRELRVMAPRCDGEKLSVPLRRFLPLWCSAFGDTLHLLGEKLAFVEDEHEQESKSSLGRPTWIVLLLFMLL